MKYTDKNVLAKPEFETPRYTYVGWYGPEDEYLFRETTWYPKMFDFKAQVRYEYNMHNTHFKYKEDAKAFIKEHGFKMKDFRIDEEPYGPGFFLTTTVWEHALKICNMNISFIE